MERARAGQDIVITRRGKFHLRLSAMTPRLALAV
jgi:antitoxin (DNA-binding transcriptional repressor) of toxin-antitoxin stability system